MAMNAAGSVYDTTASPPLVSQGANGTISGGILRPGSIDQGHFAQMLAQAQANREAAGVGGRPVSMTIPAFQGNIPTLSSAQFAALVGAQANNPAYAGSDDAAAADPNAVAQSISRVAAPTAAAQAYGMPTTSAMKLTGRAAQPVGATPQAGPNAGAQASAETSDADAPTIARVGTPTLLASATTTQATANGAAAPDAEATAAAATDAASTDTATGAAAADGDPSADAAKTPPSDPNVVHLKDAPDRETQRNLMAQHKRWIVDETPGSRQLFFGADGKFGWDDFLDVINPLQHIPIVAQIYRAVTGDQISGAAELIGSIPFGPLGVVGFMGTIADLAVKDTTGKDIGDNLEAMVFGTGKDKNGTTGGSGDTSNLAEATAAHPNLDIQTASSEPAEPAGYNVEAARTAHDARRA
jgi:hypothetical protein